MCAVGVRVELVQDHMMAACHTRKLGADAQDCGHWLANFGKE